jgi:hypothetical protein
MPTHTFYILFFDAANTSTHVKAHERTDHATANEAANKSSDVTAHERTDHSSTHKRANHFTANEVAD